MLAAGRLYDFGRPLILSFFTRYKLVASARSLATANVTLTTMVSFPLQQVVYTHQLRVKANRIMMLSLGVTAADRLVAKGGTTCKSLTTRTTNRTPGPWP